MDNNTDFEPVTEIPFDEAQATSIPVAESPETVPIHFSEKLCHPFTAKDGREFVSISIPPKGEHEPWGQIAVPANRVHDDKNNHGKYTYLIADAQFSVQYRHSHEPEPGSDKKTYSTETVKMSGRDIADAFTSTRQRDPNILITVPNRFIGTSFTTAQGQSLTRVSVPPIDDNPWRYFMVATSRLETQEKKTVIHLPQDKMIYVQHAGKDIEIDENTGEPIYGKNTTEKLSAQELKSIYDRNREQVMSVAKEGKVHPSLYAVAPSHAEAEPSPQLQAMMDKVQHTDEARNMEPAETR